MTLPGAVGDKVWLKVETNTSVFSLAMKLLEKYTDRDCPPSQFLEERLDATVNSDSQVQSVFAGHKPEVTKLFLHILRMETFLLVIVDEYCRQRRLREDDDKLLLVVILYVLVFKLPRSPLRKVKALLLFLHPKKSHHFLHFLANIRDLNSALTQAATSAFDYDYAEKNILRPFLDDKTLVQGIFEEMKQHFVAEELSKKRPPTIPVMPKMNRRLSPPPPPPATTPRRSVISTSSAVPSTTYAEPVEMQTLRKLSASHQLEALKRFEVAQSKTFHCATAQKSQRYYKTLAQIEQERCAEARGDSKVTNPPAFNKMDVPPIKMNATTMLREAARIQKAEIQQMKEVEAMANGGVNVFYYENLEQEEFRRQEEKRMEDVARRHLEAQLAFEEALLAKSANVEKKRQKREIVQKEKAVLAAQMEQLRLEEEQRVKESIEKTQKSHQGARDALASLHDRKVKQVQDINKESRELKQKVLHDRDEEMARKIELIREIKALQSVRQWRVQEVDFTQTPGYGLMDEMSFAELQERLYILKIDLQEELKEKQSVVRQQRERQQQLVADTQQLIQQHRQARRSVAKAPRNTAVTLQSPVLDDLRKQLEAKREARKKSIVQLT